MGRYAAKDILDMTGSSQSQAHGSCHFLHKMGPIHIPHGWEPPRPPFTQAHGQLIVAGRLVFFTGVINCRRSSKPPPNRAPATPQVKQQKRQESRRALCWRQQGFPPAERREGKEGCENNGNSSFVRNCQVINNP